MDGRACHVVQISFDEALFDSQTDDEPLNRQLNYARLLAARSAQSRLSIVVMTRRRRASAYVRENLEVVPAPAGPFGRLKLYATLRRLHRKHAIDVITTQSILLEAFIAVLFAWWHRCRVIGQLHYDMFSAAARQASWDAGLRAAIAKFLMRYLFAVRTVSNQIARYLQDRKAHWNVHVIPVPVRAAEVAEHFSVVRGRRVLYVGRLMSQKGLDTWIKVAAVVVKKDPSVEFDIVGDGPMRAALQHLAHKLGVSANVRFGGRVPNGELWRCYRSSSVFLLTSRYEGLPRVLLEAYAHGLPAVATRISGVEEVIEHGVSGYLHAEDDIDAMAHSVLILLNDPARRHAMAEHGCEQVRRKYPAERLASRWVDLWYSSLVPRPTVLLMPRRPTFRRWREVGGSRYTLLRALEYETIRGLVLKGRTLDIGGGAVNSYYPLLHIKGSIESVNIEGRVRPSVISDLNRPLPFSDGAFDNVVSFNTFEHIQDDQFAISESLRVLRSAGQFHFLVPFLYSVHGSPGDYHRHTAQWWIACLTRLGIPETKLSIDPLVWDRLSSAYSFIGHGPVGVRLKRLITLPAVIRGFRWRGQERLPNDRHARQLLNVPLGYYIRGVK